MNKCDGKEFDSRAKMHNSPIGKGKSEESGISLADKKLLFISSNWGLAGQAELHKWKTEKEKDVIKDDADKCKRERTGQLFRSNRFGENKPLSKNIIDHSQIKFDDAVDADVVGSIFYVGSGVYALEHELQQFGSKYATGLKTIAISSKVNESISALEKKAENIRSSNSERIAVLSDRIDSIRSDLIEKIEESAKEYIRAENSDLNTTEASRLGLDNKQTKHVHMNLMQKAELTIYANFKHGVGRYSERSKNELITECEGLLEEFSNNANQEGEKLLHEMRDNLIKSITCVVKSNSELTDDEKDRICKINPPQVNLLSNPKQSIGNIYDGAKSDKTAFYRIPIVGWWRWILDLIIGDLRDDCIDKEELKRRLSDWWGKQSAIFRRKYIDEYVTLSNNIVTKTSKEFLNNLDNYSSEVKAMSADKDAMLKLQGKILKAIEELNLIQIKLESEIWGSVWTNM
jgi:hypothetical protein